MIRNILTFSIAFAACAFMAAPSAQAQLRHHRLGGGIGGAVGARPGARIVNNIGTRIGGRFQSGHHHGSEAIGGRTFDQDGLLQPTQEYVRPIRTLKAASHDRFSPDPIYSYSNGGLLSVDIQNWNNSQQNVYPWHGGYQNWRFETPTALVVPPTAGYQSSYAWGVGQTRSTPIHHQFGRGGGAFGGGGNGTGFATTPYWPHSTDNFGIYPVRGPW